MFAKELAVVLIVLGLAADLAPPASDHRIHYHTHVERVELTTITLASPTSGSLQP